MYLHKAVWDGYGIDWEGPVQLTNETTVTIDELGEVLNYDFMHCWNSGF